MDGDLLKGPLPQNLDGQGRCPARLMGSLCALLWPVGHSEAGWGWGSGTRLLASGWWGLGCVRQAGEPRGL